ncbi:MAG: prolipoprotein diacylglyceryl transferase [Filimonas sp.]|nr:prolipoprotein diacylglyceryl transferase [Filimonas sp.]
MFTLYTLSTLYTLYTLRYIAVHKPNRLTFPIEIVIRDKHIPLHAITEVLAFFIGFRYFIYLRKQQGDAIEQANRIWIIIGAIFGAVIGSRLFAGLENPAALLQAENKLLYFYLNKTVVGGFLGGLFGVELAKLMIGEKQASGDLFVYPMILALIIGRIGCFSMGIHEETYGTPTALPWGMDLGDGIKRHPVSLYEIVFLVLLWIGLVRLEKKYPLQNGARFKLFMISYLVFRFLLDFIKPHYFFNIPFSTIQLTCLLGLVYYYRYILQPKKLLITT